VNALAEAESEAYAERQNADEAAEVVEQMAREAVNAEQAARGSDLALALAESGEPDQDPTTGLWSRRALERAMAAAVADDRWAYPGRVVMLVVLDDFNTIVAEHGREVGRDVFAAAAQRLTACLRPGDMAVRHGIDGFAVLLESNAVMNTARPVAERRAPRRGRGPDDRGRHGAHPRVGDRDAALRRPRRRRARGGAPPRAHGGPHAPGGPLAPGEARELRGGRARERGLDGVERQVPLLQHPDGLQPVQVLLVVRRVGTAEFRRREQPPLHVVPHRARRHPGPLCELVELEPSGLLVVHRETHCAS
jgi:GGDEF domain-containing protein